MTDIVLCSAPVMSVLRPSPGLGILHAAVAGRGHSVETLHLNLVFADRIGIDLNELLAERAPAHLLIGDLIFADSAGSHVPESVARRYRMEVEALLERRDMAGVLELQGEVAADFVRSAAGRILERRPRLVGFSTMFQQTMASLAIASAVKEADPRIAIVFGGANCHGPMGGALLRNYPQIDHVFTGESDVAFPAFADALLNGERDPASVAGQIGRGGKAPDAAPIFDLDATPIPDYYDYFRQLRALSEAERVEPSIPFESSRGCWWGQKHHCTFCGLNAEGMAFRTKSAERVLVELAELERRHGIRNFAATDNILSLAHIEEVMPAVARADGPPRRLFYEIKANLDERQIGLLADAGVGHVQPGIESLSDELLAIMRKGVDTFFNLRLMRNCREMGLTVTWSILHGFPGEPAEAYDAMADLVPLIEHLQPPVGLSKLRLDRFSPNYEQPLGFRHVRPALAYRVLHSIPEADLCDLAYFFEGEAEGAAGEAQLRRLRGQVAAWKAAWAGGTPIPQLSFVRVASGLLVRDTRRVAQAPLHYLGPAAAAVADGLRNPTGLSGLVERLSTGFPRNSVNAALDQLVDAQLVLRRGDKALSLLVEAGRERVTSRGGSAVGRLAERAQQRAAEEVLA